MKVEPDLLLDTCAIIFVALDSPMLPRGADAIRAAAADGRIRISPMSAWEIGMAMAKGRLKSPLPPAEFFRRFLVNLNAELCALTPEILIDSCREPRTATRPTGS